jgi:hypothetical protein
MHPRGANAAVPAPSAPAAGRTGAAKSEDTHHLAFFLQDSERFAIPHGTRGWLGWRHAHFAFDHISCNATGVVYATFTPSLDFCGTEEMAPADRPVQH